jgi:hypothetical protein
MNGVDAIAAIRRESPDAQLIVQAERPESRARRDYRHQARPYRG